ncbi:amidohydrolase [Zhenpiania hominis]|uniref:amidohydrolase n=1 Tax=Zhenpiania hominis TaxID=2763644 RepID=UPI0039F4F4FD
MKKAYVNGTIYTMKEEYDTCSAFVVEDGRFIYCGDDREARILAADGELEDLHGQTVLPGFTDTHQHLLAYARDLEKVHLEHASSIDELKAMIKEKVQTLKPGEWIQGAGFDHEKFHPPVLPTKEDLDAVAPNNPVLITRYCLHTHVANSAALKLGGIDRNYIPKVKNTVEFKENGEPTGRLYDQAAADLAAMIPDRFASHQAKMDAIENACRELNKVGIIGVHPIQAKHCDLFEDIGVYQDLAKQHRLTARIYAGFDELPGCGIKSGLGDEMVQYGFYKLFMDGNLGGRTAYLNEPYSDDPEQCGVINHTQEEINKLIQEAYDLDLQIGIHTIGDRAAEMLLEAIEKAYFPNPKKNVRFRLIHMSLINESIIQRMKKLPVIIDIQPMFVSTNVRWSESRVGHERAKYNYCWRRLIDEGFLLTGGSDAPCESFDPLKGTYAIVTRQGLDGYPEEGWFPEERVTPYEALSMYTKNAAYASYEEHIRGTIEAGKYADFVILDKDVFKVPHPEIKNISVLRTYLGGNLVYEKGNSSAHFLNSFPV